MRLNIKIFIDEMYLTIYTLQNQFVDFFSDKEDWKMYIFVLESALSLSQS